MAESWTEEETLELIEKYREKELLWDPQSKHHFNKVLRNDAWNDVATQLNKTVESCKKKMTSVLAALRRERSKIKKSMGTGKGAHNKQKAMWNIIKSKSNGPPHSNPHIKNDHGTFLYKTQAAEKFNTYFSEIAIAINNANTLPSTSSASAAPKLTTSRLSAQTGLSYITRTYYNMSESGSCLDNFFVNFTDNFVASCVETNLSDHKGQYIRLVSNVFNYNPVVKKRLHTKKNLDSFVNDLKCGISTLLQPKLSAG
ncbi:hypothetical protein FQR65_LT12619 [Abscondita terminalis]|nr:hypothetical protein FQR65_LT12619 [Abscondita terminalis]